MTAEKYMPTETAQRAVDWYVRQLAIESGTWVLAPVDRDCAHRFEIMRRADGIYELRWYEGAPA